MPISTAERRGNAPAQPHLLQLSKVATPGILAAAILGGLILAPADGRAQDAGGTTGSPGGSTFSPASGTSFTPAASGPIGPSASVLPAAGLGAAPADVRLGDLASQFGSTVPSALQPSQRPWNISGSLSVGEEYVTGNQANQVSLSGDQFVTQIQPSIQAQANTTRLQAQLFYAPQIEIYSRDSSQNQVAHDLNGRVLATLVPQTLFLDLRGDASVQSVAAAQGTTRNTVLSRGNAAQTYDFSVSPYALHRFGDLGTGEIGGAFTRTLTSTLSNTNPTLAALANQQTSSTGGHVAFVTGEAFTRYNGTVLGQVTRYSGDGALSDAHRDTATLDNGYALTHTMTALGMIGWQDLSYSGITPLRINEPVWNVGARLVPSPDSTITLRYGRNDGRMSFTLDAAVQATARIRIYARYSSGLTTESEQLQTILATSDLDAAGNLVDHTTGAPLLPTGDFFGLQNNLTRTTLASLSATLAYDRDSFSLDLNHQDAQLVSAGTVLGAADGNTHGTYGTITWSHDLRPDLQGSLSVQEGIERDDGPPSFTTHLTLVAASLRYTMTPSLSANASFSYSRTTGNIPAQQIDLGATRGTQSTFLVSLVKTFSD